MSKPPVAKNERLEAEHKIADLTAWLAERPAPTSTPAREKMPWFQNLVAARMDRVRELEYWQHHLDQITRKSGRISHAGDQGGPR